MKKYTSQSQLQKNYLTSAKNYDSEEEETLDDEYDKEATPGPGYYQLSKQNSKSFRSKKKHIKSIFMNKQSRFFKNDVHFQEVTYVNDEDNKLSKIRNQGFLSKCKRDFINSVSNNIPAPGQYQNRNTIQHISITKMLKSSNSPNFFNSSKRFNNAISKIDLGPGSYEIQRNNLENTKNCQTSAFRSSINRELFGGKKEEALQKNISKKVQRQKIIHTQEYLEEDNKQNNLPPFLTSSSRFPVNYQSLNTFTQNSKPLKAAFAIIPNKQAFNSSSRRQYFKPLGQGVGVGLYQPFRQYDWNKRSYNILFF